MTSQKIREMVQFDMQLPKFCQSRIVRIDAYVDEDAVGDHDMILGRRFCNKLGLIIDCKNHGYLCLSIGVHELSGVSKVGVYIHTSYNLNHPDSQFENMVL